jgi:alkyl hydroperoxide reductase subunit AhpF
VYLRVLARGLADHRAPDRGAGRLLPDLFAAGDVRHGSIKRVAGAVGEGAMAAALAYSRLTELGVTV